MQYHIRFNTKHNNETNLVWRVFEGETEHLVRALRINVPVVDSTTFEHGEQKWNISCEGKLEIIDDIAYITQASPLARGYVA